MSPRVPLLALLAALVTSPAWAIKEWYVHYEEALRHIGRGRCQEALVSLREAQRQKPRSALQQQTYGLNFVDYLPYFQQGVCQARLGDHAAAVALFNTEEQQGAIKRTDKYAELLKLRGESEARAREEAEAAERQRKAQLALEEVRRLRREGDDLYRAGRLNEALVRLAQAQKAAELLDPATRQAIVEKAQKIQQEAAEKEAQAERAQRIEAALQAGDRLLQEGRPADAKLRFDEVLGIEPGNAQALQGQRQAEEHILAFTTRQEREQLYREGRRLFEAGDYEKALRPLAEAAADPDNAQARDLLEKARATVERMRQLREQRLRIEALLAEAEALLGQRKFPDAMVRLTNVLALDPTHPRARERLALAERMTGHEIIERIFPNQQPVLTFLEAPSREMEGDKVAVVGLASDDRGLARIEYRLGGELVIEQPLNPDRDTGDFPRSHRIEHVFPLQPGANEISVTAVDITGARRVAAFPIIRRLRFYETKAFVPASVGAALGLVGLGLGAQRMRRRRAVRRRFNPYIAGAPVMDEEMFFGRRKLLARIMNVLHHNSLMITGERRIGKTTFLYRLKKELEADEGTEYKFFPVFTDLQGVAEDGFFHAVMADVTDAIAPRPETQEALRLRPDRPAYDGRDFSHDLQRIIEELKTRTSRKVKLVLLIDEVDVLNQYSERINQRLRSIFMKTFSEHLVAIMSGVGIKRTWTSEGSPWYNFFDEIELTAFTREEAEALIREPVEGVFRFAPEAVEKILAYSQLKPYLVQKYCIHAINVMLEEARTTVGASDVDAVVESVHFDGEAERPLVAREASA